MKIQKIKQSLVILVLQICVMFCYGQNVHEDLVNINKAYSKLNTFSVDAVFNLYENYTIQIPAETQNVKFIRSRNLYYYKLSKQETIRNGKYFVIADHENKVIIIDSFKSQPDPGIYNYLAIINDLDSLMPEYEEIKFSKKNQTQNCYSFKTKSDNIPRLDVYFNNTTYLIEKVVLFMDLTATDENDQNAGSSDKPKIEIIYKNINTHYTYNESDFSEKRFVSIRNNMVYLNPDYYGYQLYNQLID